MMKKNAGIFIVNCTIDMSKKGQWRITVSNNRKREINRVLTSEKVVRNNNIYNHSKYQWIARKRKYMREKYG